MFRWFICISIMIYKEVMAHLGSRQDRWRPSWIFVNLGHFHHADHSRFFTLARRPYFQAITVEKLNKAILLRLNHLFTGLLCFMHTILMDNLDVISITGTERITIEAYHFS